MADEGKLDDKKRDVQEYWFNHDLDDGPRGRIIEKAFNEAHPTNDDKRDAVRRYETSQ